MSTEKKPDATNVAESTDELTEEDLDGISGGAIMPVETQATKLGTAVPVLKPGALSPGNVPLAPTIPKLPTK